MTRGASICRHISRCRAFVQFGVLITQEIIYCQKSMCPLLFVSTLNIGLRLRCPPCHARHHFDVFLVYFCLGRDEGQMKCSAGRTKGSDKPCGKPLYERPRYCELYLQEWSPEKLTHNKEAMEELKSLFSDMASKQ